MTYLKTIDEERELPWNQSPARFGKSVCKVVPCDSALLGVLRYPKPSYDEVINAYGLKPDQLDQWFNAPWGRDPLIKTALRLTSAQGSGDQASSSLPLSRSQRVLHLIWPENVEQKTYWQLVLVRKQKKFSDSEILAAQLLLRQWQCRFLQPTESSMNRLLLGHDYRLISTDLDSQRQLLGQTKNVEEFATTLLPVLEQRYQSLADDRWYDLSFTYANKNRWIWLKRRRPCKSKTGQQFYIELRPMAADGIPLVGLLKDDRLAAAIGFIHKEFEDNPSLRQVASHAHMSQFHFHRLFSKQVGVSPKHYQLRMQLHIAKWQLRTTSDPIHSIAENLCFSSHGHFTSTFHRMIGMSPREYRMAN